MSYVGAPYNFVPLGSRVYRKDSITKHNEITGLSGSLEYQVTAQTPILVDGGDEHFYKNKDGKAAIPGSTMRGLVRSNMQILSQSSIVDDIGNAKLMYRSVGASSVNLNKKVYDTTLGADTVVVGKGRFSVLKNVKGGYIACRNGKYYIIPSSVDKLQRELGEMNYYVLSERRIIEDHFRGFEILKQNPCVLQNSNTKPFIKSEIRGRVHYKGEKNSHYQPYFTTVYYQPKGTRNISALSDKPLTGYKKGTLITTGFMNEKKALYVIPEMANVSENEWIQIQPQDVDSFKRDFEVRQNQLTVATGYNLARMDKEDKEQLKKDVCSFFGLPENGETKPVFYIELGGKLYFGFTPRLRLFYDKEIYDGLSKEQRDNSLDYCKSLFGFTTDKESYRSRLSFQEAVIDKNTAEGKKETMVLGEPKPTSYLDYLTGRNGEAATYRGDFSLRGMKQYWLHEKPSRAAAGNNDNVGSNLYPYPQGTSFTGRIRFTNLSEEELGMLLWSLLLEKDSQQNIGKGKPYGYGRISVSLKHLNILNPDALYSSDSLCLDPYQDQKEQCEEYIGKAKQDMTAFVGKDIMEYPPVRNFLWMKNAKEIPADDQTRYMHLGDKQKGQSSEYQDRQRDQEMLPTIGVVLGKEKKKATSSNKHVGYGNGNGGYKGGGYSGNNKNGQNRGNGGWNNQKPGRRNDSESHDYSSGGSASTSFGDLLKGLKLN